ERALLRAALAERFAEALPDAAHLGAFLDVEAQQELAALVAEVLHRQLAQVEVGELAAKIAGGRRLGEADADVRAAAEVDAVVQTYREEQDQRDDVEDRRERDEEASLADEVDVEIAGNELAELRRGRRRGLPCGALAGRGFLRLRLCHWNTG